MKKILALSLALLASFPLFAGDVDPATVAKKKQTPQGLYLSPQEAYDMTKNDPKVIFVDVRTPSELEFVGAASVMDINIPYMLNDFSDWDGKKNRYKKVPNSNFTVAMEEALESKGLDSSAKIILMCRSGSRSTGAAKLLAKAGYNNVYSIVEGFEGGKAKSGPSKGQRVVNGWKNAGLPWSYKLAKEKMHFADL